MYVFPTSDGRQQKGYMYIKNISIPVPGGSAKGGSSMSVEATGISIYIFS